MSSSAAGVAIRLLLGVCALSTAQASQYLIATCTKDGAWGFQPVETLLVNGKEMVRGVALSREPAAEWDAKSISRQQQFRLTDFSILWRGSDGVLLGRSSDGEWRLLLPENGKVKAPAPVAQLWAQAAVEVRANRRDKASAPVQMDILYAILPGQDPEAAAAALATDPALHQAPGVSEADAMQWMLHAMPAVVKIFPHGPGGESVHKYLARGMTERLTRWREGDVEVAVLQEASALAGAAATAYPGDAELGALTGQVEATYAWLDRRVAILKALDVGRQSDAFLMVYRDFEVYDKSFAPLAQARLGHLKASAAAHLQTALEMRQKGDYANAIRQLLIAKWRDPQLLAVNESLEQVRLEAARLAAQKFADTRAGLDPGAPAQVQKQRKLLLAEQYLNDGKLEEVEKTLQEAEAIDADEPRLVLLSARVAIARGELGRALAMLDNYVGLTATPQDLAEGEKLRASVLYTIQKERTRIGTELGGALDQQRFAAALEAAAAGLKVDNEASDFLYFAGVNACILRSCNRAAPVLERYLDLTDSTATDRARRVMATRLLREASAEPKPAAPVVQGASPSWFSGTPLARGVYYDPVSLSFQPKVARIDASDHASVAYEWSGGQLRAVHAKYEGKKLAATANPARADRETNDFYFNYDDEQPQIVKISRENMVVRTRKVPISMPGMGGGGGGSKLGSLFGVMSALSGTRGLGAMSGFKGAGMSRAASGLLRRASNASANASANAQVAPEQYSVRQDPEGGSSAGYLTLWNNPRVDTRIAERVIGKRAAVGFSGNRYFHPFGWDAIHLFELAYDDDGRVVQAWEMGEASAPRLDFTWDGQRLMRVTGRDNSSGAVVYTRTLNYNGERLVGELISPPSGKSSKIDYKYDKQGRLVEAVCDTDAMLDGRSRKVRFMSEEN